MARAASRPPTTKAKAVPTPAKPEPAPRGVKAFTKRLTAVRTRTPKKPAKPAPPAAAKGKKPAAKNSPAGPRPLPLYLRIPAMAVGFAVLVGFGAVLARLTLEPSPASVPLIHTNLRPGHSIEAYLDQPALRDAVRQIGGNILLGVPFGILVPVVAPKARGIIKVLFLTALVMLAVEFAQGALVTGRAFDIDDVILNTTGALIGYLLLGRRLGRGVHARRG
ncbi:VanZ family protein [Streptomyces acidiscabies]|uniref:VanZ family protein n=1 Tax=Streptomyces acidiscabies TaxID=42234 RepID=UPI00076ED40E|nr:VanZ like family protein [Streptomyces acidiscabies]GAV42716.1 VanZ like family protein [Streptomyces acidiscabies]